MNCEVCGREKARDVEHARMVTALCEREITPRLHGAKETCWRLGYERSQAALAAARRECEGLRKRVREVRADMTPTNMQYEAHFLRQWIVSWAKKLDAALAAPAAGDSK